MAPVAATNYGMHQYQNQPQGYHPFWQSQGSSNGLSYPQNANGFNAHHTNAQVATPPAFSAGIPSTPYGGYANTAQYNTAPAQFHSSVPSTAYATTPWLHQPAVSLNHSSAYKTAVSDPSSRQRSPPVPPRDLEEPLGTKRPSAELEDGELSSGKSRKLSEDHNNNTEVVQERSTPELLRSHITDLNRRGDIDSSPKLDGGTCGVLL